MDGLPRSVHHAAEHNADSGKGLKQERSFIFLFYFLAKLRVFMMDVY